MTEAEARSLRERRMAERPEFAWVLQRRGGGDWAVIRLPAGARIDPATVESSTGEPAEVRDDPRPTIFRDFPPYGP